MTAAETRDRVPVATDLFEWSEDGVDLIGSQCSGCGTHYFPRSLSCRNPACETKVVADVRFGRRGTLRSWTVQAYRPPPLFRMDEWAPYVLGLVELPEGLRVLAMIGGCGPADVAIGLALRLDVAVLYRDEAGRDVVTYTYVPVGG